VLFSRESIIEALPIFEKMTHAEIDRFALRFGLEQLSLDETTAKYKRANAIGRHLISNPGLKSPTGGDLAFDTIDFLVGVAKERRLSLEEDFPGFIRSLKRDGYIIDNYELKKTLPSNSELPLRESELSLFLDNFGFSVSKGHLEQAINAHTRGEWASSNAQLRTFVESLFDSIAEKLKSTSNPLPQNSSQQRREYLAKLSPPFLLQSLNEWEIGCNGGFIQGFWRRLHPQGAHPGLSDEDDSTFRLQLVVLVAHHLLKRLSDRLGP
jgi:hypothetical protein